MSDNLKASYHGNRVKEAVEKDQPKKEPDVDVVGKSQETKNQLYGEKYQHGKKFVGAANANFKDRQRGYRKVS